MKKFALAALMAAMAAGCSSPSEPDPPASLAGNFNYTYNVPLLASNEVPAISNAEANVSGNATIVLHVTKNSAGAITAATADFSVQTAGFPAGSTVTSAHIHPGGSGATGSVLVSLGITSADAPVTNGTCSFTRNAVTVTNDQASAITASPSQFYFNVHSSANTGGVARGQLASGAAGQPDPQPVPY